MDSLGEKRVDSTVQRDPAAKARSRSRADATSDENSMRQYNIYTRVIQKCTVIMRDSYSSRNKCYFVTAWSFLTDRRLDFQKKKKKYPSLDSTQRNSRIPVLCIGWVHVLMSGN